MPSDRPDPGDEILTVADRDQLERGFRRLPPEHRAILVLHHYLGMSPTEIAENLGVPAGTARSRLHYAHRAMRAALEAESRQIAAEGRGSMNTGLDIERVLDVWLEDGPHTIAERVVDDALRTVERTEQQRGWRSIVRVPARPIPLRLAAYMALVLALALGAAVIAGVLGGHVFLPQPITTASPPPSSPVASAVARPSATPVLRASKPPRPAGATLLLMGNPMTAGQTYTTLSFEPAFTIAGADGWQVPLPAPGGGRLEGPAHAYFFGGQPSGNPLLMPTLSIIRPAQAITEGGAATEQAPADLLAGCRPAPTCRSESRDRCGSVS